jgi:glycosyltransferase involved in cell wall biosynthesis
MQVLAILYCYPPLLFPATMCNLKVVKGLEDCGAGVEVVTVDPETFVSPADNLTDPALEELLSPGIVNHRIRSWEINPVVKGLKAFALTRTLLYRVFEPRKNEWTYPALRRLMRLGPEKFDLILSCSQPHCNHLLGYRLKKLTGKPWVAYFSDPWTDNVYASYPEERIKRYHLALENQVLSNADRIYFTSAETADLVLRKYPPGISRKCDVLTHSFVPQWYRLRDAGGGRDGKIRIVQTGHFYGPRTPIPLFRALAKVAGRVALEERLEFLFYGSMDERYRRYMQEHGLDRIVRLMGTVPYLESLAVMKDADFLLLIDAPLKELAESVYLPSKLVDYFGSGKPVLGITPAAGTSARVLRETGNLVCDVGDGKAIEEMLENLAAGSLRVAPDVEALRRYEITKVSQPFYDDLQRLVMEGRMRKKSVNCGLNAGTELNTDKIG